MRLSAIVILAAAAGMLAAAGCKHRNQGAGGSTSATGDGARVMTPPERPMTTPDEAAAVRKQWTGRDATIITGMVTAVLPERRWAQVGNVPMDQFTGPGGQPVVFVDGGGNSIASGRVVRVEGNELIVEYTADPTPPRVGDVMVRFRR